MRKAILGLILAGTGLAGCATPLEVGRITEINAPPGSQGIDVYASRRIAGEKVPEFAGDQIVEVRTYARDDNGVREELAGASCALSARDFTANLTTPAKVRVPIYRAQSSPLSVRCEKAGFMPKLKDVGVFGETTATRLNNGASAGLIGFVVMAAVDAATDPATHDYKYPKIELELARPPRGSSGTTTAAIPQQ